MPASFMSGLVPAIHAVRPSVCLRLKSEAMSAGVGMDGGDSPAMTENGVNLAALRATLLGQRP
jgi:hypothetical protein